MKKQIIFGLLIVTCMTLGLVISAGAAITALDGFNPEVAGGFITAIVHQDDGKVLIGGNFTQVKGESKASLARLNADGSLDASFPGALVLDGVVEAIAIQKADGKILIGGDFTGRIKRIDGVSGSVDAGFTPPAFNANSSVYAIKVQSDGKILIGGDFNLPQNNLARLNANGTHDSSFATTADDFVYTIEELINGQILAGGAFTGFVKHIDTSPSYSLTSFTLNGSPFVFDEPVYAIKQHSDGRIMVGGEFTDNFKIFNIDGSMINGVTSPGDAVVTILQQYDGKILLGGFFSGGIKRLTKDGAADTVFSSLPNGFVYAVSGQSDGKILLGGVFTAVGSAVRNNLARLYQDGSVEVDFNQDDIVNGSVYAVAVQPDRKVLIGGQFTSIGGVSQANLARFNADGTLDTGFTPNVNNTVNAIVAQADGKILIGGAFTSPDSKIARLNSNGTTDGTFTPPNVNNTVNAIAVQADGKILIGGAFTSPSANIARLTSNGTTDETFSTSVSGGAVNTIAVQADGKILIGGAFTSPAANMARLTSSGATDTFSAGVSGGAVNAIVIDASGKIVVGGAFTSIGGQSRNRLARLAVGGSDDGTSFNPDMNGGVVSLALDADGNILAGGTFTTVGGASASYIARLTPAGILDATFDPLPDQSVTAVLIQFDGKVFIGGSFLNVSGATRYGIARLNSSGKGVGLIDVPITVNGQTKEAKKISWNRSGMNVPEIARATYEISYDDVSWSAPADMSRVSGALNNWEKTGLSLDLNRSFYVRVRGYISGGQYNGSQSVMGQKKYIHLATQPALTTGSAANNSSPWPAMTGTVQNAANSTVQFEFWAGIGGAPANGGTMVNVQQVPITAGSSVPVSKVMIGLGEGTYTYRLRVSNAHFISLPGTTNTFTVTLPSDTAVVGTGTSGITIPAAAGSVSDALSISISNCPKVKDVNVLLAVAHPKVNDLAVTLQHGAAPALPIVQAVGTCANADIDVVLDDSNTANTNIGTPASCGATPPAYSGLLNSAVESQLSNFNGVNSSNTWTLTVTNSGTQGGTVLGWGLILTCASQLDVNFGTAVEPSGTSYFKIYNSFPTPSESLISCVETCPAGNCSTSSTDCSEEFSNFASVPQVTLSATSDGNWDVDSWSVLGGACNPAGSPTCALGMNDNKTVTANFVEIADFNVPPLIVGSDCGGGILCNAYVGFSACFEDMSNHDTSWSWAFGDGNTSTAGSPGHICHTYAAPGSKNVTLTVNATARFQKTKSINVGACSAVANPVRLASDNSTYINIAAAYIAAAPNNPNVNTTMELLEGYINVGGELSIINEVTLEGGYFCDFGVNPNPQSASAIAVGASDSITITTGSVIID